MARMTKRQAGEYVIAYYGINAARGTVDTVYERRDGQLVISRLDGTDRTHMPLRRRTAEHEMLVVWHLTDIFSVSMDSTTDDSTMKRVQELQVKAAAAKAAREKAKE
jgi:hypothetical protein